MQNCLESPAEAGWACLSAECAQKGTLSGGRTRCFVPHMSLLALNERQNILPPFPNNGWGAQLKGDSKADGVIPLGAFVQFYPDPEKGYKLHGQVVKQHTDDAGGKKPQHAYDIQVKRWSDTKNQWFTPTDERQRDAFALRTFEKGD